MTIVPDTNVIISAYLSPQGNNATIFELWLQSEINFAFSPAILDEIQGVLGYQKIAKHLKWSERRVREEVERLKRGAELVPNTELEGITLTDPKDAKILACAEEAEADFVVTGDKLHLLPLKEYQGIPIITPKEFLQCFEAYEKAETYP